VENTWPVFANNPDVTSMHMGFVPIIGSGARKDAIYADNKESKQNMDDFLKGESKFCGATSAYRKILINNFEPLSYQTKDEDYPLFFRSMLIGGAHYCLPTHGIYYIRHDKAISNLLDFDIWARVYLQNIIDLEYIINNGVITSPDLIHKIKNKLRNGLECSLMRTKYRQSKCKLFFIIFEVMPASCYSRERKIKIITGKISRFLHPRRKNGSSTL
jgi:hypothetical protein